MPPQASPPRRVLATAVGTVGAMCGAVGGSASALFTTATSLLLVLLSYCIPLRRHSVKYCCNNDQKYLSDDEQTVPVIWLGVICVMGPLLTHVLYTVAFKEAPDQRDSEAFLHGYIGTMGLQNFAVNALKNYVARPRPNYFQRCDVVVDNECDASEVEDDALRSFPSGHAGDSFAALSFTSLYLLGKVKPAVPRPRYLELGGRRVAVDLRDLCMLGALLPAFVAAFVAASRIVDYMHHADDVVAGSLIGLGSAQLFYARYFHSAFHPVASLAGEPRASLAAAGDQKPGATDDDAYHRLNAVSNGRGIGTDDGTCDQESESAADVSSAAPTTTAAHKSLATEAF